MKEIPAADKTFATIGAVLWSIQVVPQIIHTYRTKNVDGLSPLLMFIWGVASIFQGSYLVAMRSSIPLQVQPQAFGFFCVVSWGQILFYGSKYSLKKTLLCMGAFYCFFAAFESGSVHLLWLGERNGVFWPEQLYGWLTSALLIAGLLPQYWEIWKYKEVVGISLLFMSVDIFGGVFSGVSLFFRETFDSTAFVQYALVVVLDGLVVVLAFILNPLARRRRARQAALQDAEHSASGDDGDVRAGEAVEVVNLDANSKRMDKDSGCNYDANLDDKPFAVDGAIDEEERDKQAGYPFRRDDGRIMTAASELTAVGEGEVKV